MKKTFRRTLAALLCAATLTASASAIMVYPDGTIVADTATYTDVSTSDSFYDAVQFVNALGLMNGTSDTQFSPAAPMTRGMFVTILGRLAGIDPKGWNWNTSFTDVPDSYYKPYVTWAAKKGIVNGTSATTFSPNENVTHEQTVKMLAEYAKMDGYNSFDMSRDKMNGYADHSKVASYAAQHMAWCVNTGIYTGNNGMLSPKSNTTRSEIASMVKNLSVLLHPENGTHVAAAPNETQTPQTENKPDTQDKPAIENEPSHVRPEAGYDEIDQRPTGKSPVDENGGWYDYDLSNKIFDEVNDIREANGKPRLKYSLKIQEWADIRAKEAKGAYADNLYGPHERPDGTSAITVSKGYNVGKQTENAGFTGGSLSFAQDWYESEGHRKNMLSDTEYSAVSIYIRPIPYSYETTIGTESGINNMHLGIQYFTGKYPTPKQ